MPWSCCNKIKSQHATAHCCHPSAVWRIRWSKYPAFQQKSALPDLIMPNARQHPALARRLVSETLGTAFLLATVIGSGIMGERLAGGNIAIALLANTLATGAALVALILTFGSISGAHFNPVVTIAMASQRKLPWREVPGYVTA